MSLFAAMKVILVDEGNLYLYRLPPEQVAAVDLAYVPLSGVGAQRYLGSEPVANGLHDGGILWYHKGVQFQLRGKDPEDPEKVEASADRVRDLLIQFAGTSVVKADEEIVKIDLSSGPAYYGQDEQERPIAALTVEVWHRPSA